MDILWKIIPQKVRVLIIWPIIGVIVVFWDTSRKLTLSDILLFCVCGVYFVFISIPLMLLCIPFLLIAVLFSPLWAGIYISSEERQAEIADTLNMHQPPPRLQAIAPPIPEVIPSCITTSSAPPPLCLETPYTSDTLTLTVHSYKKRRSFYPMPNRFEPRPSTFELHNLNQVRSKHFEPESPNRVKIWFVEFTCTLKNTASDNVYVWGQLEEVLLDNTAPRYPLVLRQFYPLTDDEATDIFPGSSPALEHVKHNFEVKNTVENTLFFKVNERMQLRTMAFSLHISSAQQGLYQSGPALFTVNMEEDFEPMPIATARSRHEM